MDNDTSQIRAELDTARAEGSRLTGELLEKLVNQLETLTHRVIDLEGRLEGARVLKRGASPARVPGNDDYELYLPGRTRPGTASTPIRQAEE